VGVARYFNPARALMHISISLILFRAVSSNLSRRTPRWIASRTVYGSRSVERSRTPACPRMTSYQPSVTRCSQHAELFTKEADRRRGGQRAVIQLNDHTANILSQTASEQLREVVRQLLTSSGAPPSCFPMHRRPQQRIAITPAPEHLRLRPPAVLPARGSWRRRSHREGRPLQDRHRPRMDPGR
jgi:hypothetical protein